MTVVTDGCFSKQQSIYTLPKGENIIHQIKRTACESKAELLVMEKIIWVGMCPSLLVLLQ